MPAPGAKCRDCIAAARNLVAPAPEDVVKARDHAILEALKLRRWLPAGLISVLPQEQGQTGEERKRALDSALIRLQVKGFIRQLEDGTLERVAKEQ